MSVQEPHESVVAGNVDALYRDKSGKPRMPGQQGATSPGATPAAQLEAVFTAMADAVVVYDAKGRIVASNGGLSVLLGFGDDSIFTRIPLAERGQLTSPRTPEGHLLPPDQYPSARALAGEDLRGERAVDFIVTALDGREVALNAAGGPLYDEGGHITGAVLVLRDITRRLQLEQELQATNERLAVAEAAARASARELEVTFAALPDGVAVYDTEGNILRCNAAFRTMLGFGTADISGLPPEERARYYALGAVGGVPFEREQWPLQRVIRGEVLTDSTALELRLRTVDGRQISTSNTLAPLRDDAGHVIGAVVVTRDVTERRQREREEAERAAEAEAIFATHVEAVVYADTTGRILRTNEAQRRLLRQLGIDPEAEQIALWAQKVTPYDEHGQPIPSDQLPFYRALQGETVTGEKAVELYHRLADGREQVLRVSGAPVRDPQGHILGAVLTTFDVTPLRLLERQRLDIMNMVVHDLNTPITAVRTYFQVQRRRIAAGRPPLVPGDKLLQQMEHGLTRMQRLLEDLRIATKVEMGTLQLNRERRDVVALCQEEVIAQQAVTQRVLRLEAPPEPIEAEVDEARIGQVFANLLSNALKYSPEDRPVVVTLQVVDGQARIEVRDEGPGIPEHERQYLFDQFHRVAGIEAHQGPVSLGLGLYISKAIVTLHGGDIGVESEVGAGSTFWFTLPLAADSTTTAH